MRKKQRSLRHREDRWAKARAQTIEGSLGEARSQALAAKVEAWVAEVRASKAAVEELENFKVGEKFHHMVLDSYSDAFW